MCALSRNLGDPTSRRRGRRIDGTTGSLQSWVALGGASGCLLGNSARPSRPSPCPAHPPPCKYLSPRSRPMTSAASWARASTTPSPSTWAVPLAARRWPPGREGRGGGAGRPPVGPRPGRRPDQGPEVHRPGRGGPGRRDHAHAVLRGRHPRRARLQFGHPGDRQPQPKDYNGFKMVLGGRAIYGDDIQKLRQRMETEDLCQGRSWQGPQRQDGHRARVQRRASWAMPSWRGR